MAQLIKDENSNLLRYIELTRELWVRSFHILLSTKPPKFDPDIAECLGQ